ncbi:MAG: hypothetical protein H3C47_14580 [Candidatus Cloacimonetes bacterium]|nr:hypothetical protein [Candidatus Cloacimonadota bacterium]
MKQKIGLWFYQAAYGCLFPFILLLLLKRKDTRQRVLTILGFLDVETKNQPLTKTQVDWFHAVSYGETRLAMHFLSHGIENGWVNRPVLFTTTIDNSMQYALEYMKKNHPDHTFYASFLPLDFFPCLTGLFHSFLPVRYFLFETDFWPYTIYRLKKQGCQMYLINGRISPGIQKIAEFVPSLFMPMFQRFHCLFCQSEDTLKRFLKMGITQTTVLSGQMKVDMLPAPKTLTPCFSLPDNFPVLVFGSFHRDEWTELLPMLQTAYTKSIIILVPRNIDEATWFQKQCQKSKLAAMTISAHKKTELTTTIYIINSMGFLNSIYSQASLCIVGGSFATYGGHNFLEPVALKKPVLIGPDTRNFSEDAKEFITKELIIQLKDGQDGVTQIKKFLANPKSLIEMSLRAWDNLQTKLGVTQSTWEKIQKKS